MGFGLLFIGYLLTFLLSMTSYGFIFRLLGILLLSFSLIKLRDYQIKFNYPLWCSFVLIITGIFDFIYTGAEKLSYVRPDWMTSLKNSVGWIEFLLFAFMNAAILYAIAQLARQLELDKQRIAAWRNMVFLGIYFILDFLRMGVFADNEKYAGYFLLPTFIIRILFVILNLILIFSCYMYICPEGDEDMPRKKTGIRFIDNIAEESDRRSEKARKETTEYYVKKHKDRIKKTGKKKK